MAQNLGLPVEERSLGAKGTQSLQPSSSRRRTSRPGAGTSNRQTAGLDRLSPTNATWGLETLIFSNEVIGNYEPVGELLYQHHNGTGNHSDFAMPQPVEQADVGTKATSAPVTQSSSRDGISLNPQTHDMINGRVSSPSHPKRKAPHDTIPGVDFPASRRISVPEARQTIDMDLGTKELPSTTSFLHDRPQTGRNRSAAVHGDAAPVTGNIPAADERQSEKRQRSLSPPGPRQRRRTMADVSASPLLLPARKVFPIQIGSELFRLSGASISSDAPSYFSQFFEEQIRQGQPADNVRTLYVDRDPVTFRDISLHLQGYHVEPKDGAHFVKLFADAQFFSLPRLTQQLFKSTIYVRIGDSDFQIPRDLFNSPGDASNYFSLGFAIFFTCPTRAFPGLDQRTLLRPPSIPPSQVACRSARVFADLLHVLKGYPLHIQDEEHRSELLRDARYFHLRGLEQKLIAHRIAYNPLRQRKEITIRLEDIRQSGISFKPEPSTNEPPALFSAPASASASTTTAPSPPNQAETPLKAPTGGWIHYQRPFADAESYELILELGADSTSLDLTISPNGTMAQGRAEFHGQTKSRITSLFHLVANKMNVPVTQPLGLMMLERAGNRGAELHVGPAHTGVSEHGVKVRVGEDADVVLDGRSWPWAGDGRSGGETHEWTVSKGLWRLRMQPKRRNGGGMEAILCAVKLLAFTGEKARNMDRDFL